MVSYKDIKASNALIKDSPKPLVAIFVGGTSGIGKLTWQALVATGIKTRIYLIGRKSAEQSTLALIKEASSTTVNSKAEIIWTEGEISLLAETKRICEMIKSKESHVDLLFLSAGYAPFGPRRETSEGIEIAQSLEYYSRILFVQHLLPLLNAAEAPRVISVLGGGLEKATVKTDDIDLKQPGNFGGVKAQGHYLTLNTVTLEHLSDQNPHVTFIHSWPGAVSTGNVRRGRNPNSLTAWVIWLIAEPLLWLLSYSDTEAGQRHLFQCTSPAFGGKGIATEWKGKPGVNSRGQQQSTTATTATTSNEGQGGGLFLVNYKCDCTPNEKVLQELRGGAREKVWKHTQDVLGPYL